MLKKLTFLVALLVVSQANAAHYGMAGCGVGSLVFADQPGKIQIVAATLNNLVSPQTSAITSGTSGCYEGNNAQAQVNYIEINKVSLKTDIARGNGETLEGLMTMLGCKNSEAVRSAIKNDYKNIFNTESTQQIFNAIRSNKSIQTSCSTLG